MGYEFKGIKKRIPLLLSMPHSYARYAASALLRAGIAAEDIRVTPFGLRVMTDDMAAVTGCRLYERLYLTIPIKRGEKLTCENAGQTIGTSMLKRILDSYIKGERPIPTRIRVEVPATGTGKRAIERMRDEESRVAGIFTDAIKEALPQDIEIVTSGYECEIFLPGRPDGTYGMYLWCACMGDGRFSYRRALEPTSMSAVRAATMIEMLHPYIIEEDSVLDPFCGTGTLVIERRRHGRTGNVFGTDISERMIAGARENAALSSEHIHFIQRDFFDFTYDGFFDEIITELPDLYHRSEREKRSFFGAFLKKCLSITAEGAVFGILTGEADIFSMELKRYRELETAETIGFGGKREVFVLRRL